MNIPYNRKNILNTCRQAFILLVGILSLAFCLDIPETYSEEATESYEFERMWPVLPQPWYFANATDIAVDKDGNVYVSDGIAGIIHKFTSEGNFITKWGSEGIGDGQFAQPQGVAVDSDGSVYVTDFGNNRIQKFDSDGNFDIKWGSSGSGDGQFNYPRGITVDSKGFVYVADTNNERIQKFDSDGNFITKWGSKGSGGGQFDGPERIAVDSNGNVYVADSGNDRIQKFDSDGNFITKWGSKGSGDGQFDGPEGIAVDGNDNVYVADTSMQRVQKFDSDGNFITKWGEFGSDDKQFWYPRGIEVDSDGNVYVADTAHGIQKFDSDGNFITRWGSEGSGDGQFNYPRGITVDSKGFVYVSDAINGRIQKFDSDGNFITKWGSKGSGDGQFMFPHGITVDSNGNVYVVDGANYRIQKFDSDGNFITKWGSKGSGGGQFDGPERITVDSNGNVYVADSGNDRIQKFDSDGSFIAEWGSAGSGDGQFNAPQGIAVDSNGNVYVTDYYNFRIQKFDSEGNFIAKWGRYGSGDGQLRSSHGIAVDSNGNVYVADSGNDRIQKFDSDGNFIAKWGTSGYSPGQFNGPYDLDIDTNGDLYIADAANNRIQVLKRVTEISEVSESKAIVVAGGGPFTGNNLWNTTQMLANYAYKTLTFQGYTKETIYYISADTDLDLDGNGILDDVDADATNANLEKAITAWATDASEVVIYLVDHGGDGTFRMSETEIMTAAELDSWLDILQGSIAGKLTVVYEACESGSFMDVLAPSSGQDRMLITSTSPDENAYFVSKGSISFSFIFWGHIFGGTNIYDAFTLASNAISFSIEGQTPLLDDNGNGIGNEKEDGLVAINYFIGNGTEMGGDIPLIGAVSPEQDLDGTTTSLIWAEGIVTTGTIEKVWAIIRRPDSIPGSSDIPITDLPTLDLKDTDNDGRYEGTYNKFDLNGIYEINIYAKDRNSNISLPKATKVNQQEGACAYTISPEHEEFTLDSNTGSVSVATADSCDWTASSNDPSWITITSGSSGSGPATVSYSVAEYIGTSSRTGTITIAGKTFTVTQSSSTTTGKDPTPDIKANGTDQPFSISQGYNLSITVTLGPGTHSGDNADLWVYVTSPFGKYWYTLNSGWAPSSTPIRVYGGPLFNLDDPYTILNMSTLPAGDYTFSFEVDDNMDNVMDGTYSDSVNITIE